MTRSRRAFLKASAATPAVLSLAPSVPSLLARAASAAAGARRQDTVLVVVQLSGGNDGLNTVAPYADDVYARKRSTLRLTKRDVHRISDYVGFHPRMAGFARLLKQGRLGIIQGVGYPKNSRNHPAAMRDWHTARPGDASCATGWVGRAADQVARDDPTSSPALFVGPIVQPLALRAEKTPVPTVRTPKELTLTQAPTAATDTLAPAASAAPTAAARSSGATANPLLAHARRAGTVARATSEQVQAVLRSAKGTHRYPNLGLAGDLKTVAELIRAKIGVRIFFVELGGGGIGGFDNHANQRDNHAAVLSQLSESVAAFCDDLARDKTLDRVALMTFSEFGRTVTENGRRGTGHGAAQPVFLAGGKVRAGLIGKHPSLTDLDRDAPKHHTDFRRVYATMLDTWLGFDSHPILGCGCKPLDLFRA